MTEDIRKLAEKYAPLGGDGRYRIAIDADEVGALARAVLAIDEALFEAGHGDHEDGDGCAICAALRARSATP